MSMGSARSSSLPDNKTLAVSSLAGESVTITLYHAAADAPSRVAEIAKLRHPTASPARIPADAASPAPVQGVHGVRPESRQDNP